MKKKSCKEIIVSVSDVIKRFIANNSVTTSVQFAWFNIYVPYDKIIGNFVMTAFLITG